MYLQKIIFSINSVCDNDLRFAHFFFNIIPPKSIISDLKMKQNEVILRILGKKIFQEYPVNIFFKLFINIQIYSFLICFPYFLKYTFWLGLFQ